MDSSEYTCSTRPVSKTAYTLIDYINGVRHVQDRGICFIEDEDEFFSYEELYTRSLVVLHNLQRLGVTANSELVLQIADNKDFIIVFWACILGKIIPIPLATGTQDEHRMKLLRIWSTLPNPYLFCANPQLQKLESFSRSVEMGHLFDQMNSRVLVRDDLFYGTTAGTPSASGEEDIAYIQYSSGSTGNSKGIILTHKNLVVNTRGIVHASCTAASDTSLSWMPLSHDMGLICFHLSGVAAGITQYIMPTSLFIKRPALWIEKASQYKVSQLYSPNFGYQYFLTSATSAANPTVDLSAVRIIYNGAEPISEELCDRFLKKLQPSGLRQHVMFPGYGLAEASVAVTLSTVGAPLKTYTVKRDSIKVGDKIQLVDSPHGGSGVSFVEVGEAVQNCALRITDDADAVLEEGIIGNIQIKGGNVTKGYYHNESETRKLFTDDGWLRTGDLGFVLNKKLVITGRKKNIIIINGQNYYNQDIERVAQEVEGVELGKVVACGFRNQSKGREELLIFILHKKPLYDFAALAESVKEKIIDKLGLLADHVIAIRKVPKTTSGKIQHYKLIEQYESGAFDQQIEELAQMGPGTNGLANRSGTISKPILEICNGVFGFRINADSNFFSLGASSLQIMRLVHSINKAFRAGLTLQHVFDHPTAEKLIAYLSRNGKRPGEQDDSFIKLKPAGKQAWYDLSPAQKRLWAYDQYKEGQNAFNISLAYAISGLLDVELLGQAFSVVVKRHENLRSSFITVDSVPQRVVKDDLSLYSYFKFKDVRCDAAERNSIHALVRAEANRVFCLAEGPLLSVLLIQTDERSFVLSVTLHHIIADGWSVGVMFDEVATLYKAGTPGDELLSPLRLGYQDYLGWQQDEWASPAAAVHRQYWLDELSGNVPPLDMPGVNPRPLIRTYKGQMLHVVFSEAHSTSLHALGRACGGTLFMTLVSLLNVLFYKYTGRKDLLLGTSAAGRTHELVYNQIGFYTNTLVIRTKLAGTNTFADVFNSVKEKVCKALKHQFYPFEQLLEDLEVKPDPGRSPLFDVVVILNDNSNHLSAKRLGRDVNVSNVNVEVDSSYVDLTFDFISVDQQVELSVRYNTDLFSSDQINRLIGHFGKLLDQVAEFPALLIDSYSILPEEEEKLLLGFNPQRQEVRNSQTVIDYFVNRAAETPRAVAVTCGDRVLSYGELNELANRLGNYLIQVHQVGEGDCVGVLLQRNENLVASILAILKTGAAYVPIDPDFPVERVQFILNDCQAKILLFDVASKPDFPEKPCKVLLWEHLAGDLSGFSPACPARCPDASHLAYVIYTSGTSGRPKGVLIEHGSLLDYVLTFIEYFKLSADDVVIQQSSIAFDTSIEEIFPVLCVSGRLVVLREGGRDIEALLITLEKEVVTVLSTTPLIIEQLNARATRLQSLRVLISGGDQLKGSHIDRILGVNSIALYNTYGPTETTVCATYHKVTSTLNAAIIGSPIVNRAVYITDESLRLVPIGVAGEICIAGQGLARGYLRLDEETAQRFVNNPYQASTRLYRTGDRGRWRPDGTIEFLGRQDNQIKLRGYRVELNEVEKALCLLPSVADAVVVAREEQDGEKQIVAYFTADSKLNPVDLQLNVSRWLPYYMVPAHFVQLESLSLTSNGKVDHQSLPTPVSGQKNEWEDAAPETELERKLVTIWEEVLAKKHIGVLDNFFGMGGQSLKAIQALTRINKELATNISLKIFFVHPTIKELSRIITQSGQLAGEELVPLEEKALYEVSHAQKRLWYVNQFEEKQSGYSMAWAYRINGSLDEEALEKTFRYLIERHESLRTVFVSQNGQVLQKIIAPEAFNFRMTRRRIPGAAIDQTSAQALIEEEVSRSFDLAADPLIRVVLMRAGAAQFLFLCVIHHIVVDGWSMELLLQEVLACYKVFRNGGTPDAPPLRVQYKEYAAWQNGQLEKGRLDQQKKYWLAQLRGPLPAVNLPTYQPRPAVQTHNGATIKVAFAKDLYSNLLELSLENNVTLFVTLVAAVNVLLFKYTNQKDIIIGTDAAGRSLSGLEKSVGHFLNALPLRNYVEPRMSFRQFLQNVKVTTLDAFEHQLYPYDRLVEDLDLERDVSRSPIFDVLIILQNFDRKQSFENLSETLEIEPVEILNKTCLLDLQFEFIEDKGELQLNVAFNTDLFRPAQMQRLITHLQLLCRSILLAPQEPIGNLDILSGKEKEFLLHELSAGKTSLLRDKTIVDLFNEQVRLRAGQTAVEIGLQRVSYAELDEKATEIASFLLSQGVRREQPVLLMLDKSVHAVASILGTLKAACAYVFIDPYLPHDRIRQMMNDTAAAVLITENKFIDAADRLQWECPAVKSYVCLDDDGHVPTDYLKAELEKEEEYWNSVAQTTDDEIAAGSWISSYTGAYFTREEMEEYSDNIYQKLSPYLHADANVLEIGCSTGITLLKIAPCVRQYYGTDLSAKVLDITNTRVNQKGLDNVILQRLAAHDITEIKNVKFDVIILSSVVQLFKSLGYLRGVIQQLIALSSANGVIFLGDLQDVDLKDDLISSIERFKKQHPDRNGYAKTDWSSELFLSRNFLDDLQYDYPAIRKVIHSGKIGTIQNELTQFRFDTLLQLDKGSGNPIPGERARHKNQYGASILKGGAGIDESRHPAPDDLAYILYTSGSSGRPKGVMIEHYALVDYVHTFINYFRITSNDRVLQQASFAFDTAVEEIFPTLCSGARLVILAGGASDTERMLSTVETSNVSVLSTTPLVINALNKFPERLSPVRVLISGGDKLTKEYISDLVGLPNLGVYNTYGPTETTVCASFHEIKTSCDARLIGKPIANHQIYLLNENRDPVPVGVTGEIYIAGSGLARGYLNAPEETAKSFVSNPFTGGNMYKTGDMGRWTEEGYLEFIGRKDLQLKIRGYRVETAEVEAVLLSHAYVSDAVVIGMEHQQEKMLVACIVGKDRFSLPDLQRFLISALPAYMVPARCVVLDCFPLTINGKVDRNALAKQVERESVPETVAAPVNFVEEILLNIWKKVLGKKRIATTDNFFSLGGHSLKATQVIYLAYAALKVKIGLDSFFKGATVKEQAALLCRDLTGTSNRILVARTEAHYNVSTAQRSMWIACQLKTFSGAYNIPIAHIIEGKLDVPVLERAFKDLVRRHDVLRTAFVVVNNEPKQKVLDYGEDLFKLRTLDLRLEGQPEEFIKNYAIAEAAVSFKLEEGCLLRVTLLHVEDEKFFLLLVIHHIISDWVSIEILTRELITTYGALKYSGGHAPEPPQIQYKDYVAWQEQQVAGRQGEAHKKYWLQPFNGAIAGVKSSGRPAQDRTGILQRRHVADGAFPGPYPITQSNQ